MARVEDVTDRLLSNVSGPGERVKRVHQTKPALTLTPALAKFFDTWKTSRDKTVGFVSNALAYASKVSGPGASYHTNMIRLIKGGHIRACQVNEKPPAGSAAHRDSPYGERFYVLQPNSCPTDIDPANAPFMGRRRR
jgi:hypothetical protein